jgi:hypothetical protein
MMSNAPAIFIADPISSNTITGNQTVFGTDMPSLIVGSTLANGFPYSGTPYFIFWERSTDNANWSEASGTAPNGRKDFQAPAGLTGNVYFRRRVQDMHSESISNSVLLNYQNTYPLGSIISNAFPTSTFDINCQEYLQSVNSLDGNFTNREGGANNDVYFKIISNSTQIGVNSCQSSPSSTTQSLYDANFNPMTIADKRSDCFFFQYLPPGTYYVRIELNGTINLQLTTWSYSDCPDNYTGFGFASGESQSMSLVYPNPTQNTATLKLSKSSGETKKIQVYNKHNTLVKSFETNRDEISFSVEDLPADVYYIKVIGEKKSETHRLVVK